MNDRFELTWRLYQEHCTWERHHEAQRASVTNLLLAVSAAVLGVITYDGGLWIGDLPLTLFLILLGLFGALFVAKQYERFAMQQGRAGRYRGMLDEMVPEAAVLKLRNEADAENEARYPRLSRIRLHRFWTALHLLVAGFGVVLTVIIITVWLLGEPQHATVMVHPLS